MSLLPGGPGKWVLESDSLSLSPARASRPVLSQPTTLMDSDTDLLCSTPCRRLRRCPKDSLVLVHLLQVPRGQSPFLHLAWPGTGLGWHAPGPLFASRMTFPAPPLTLPLSQLGSPTGIQHHVCERSASAPPPTCAALLSSDPFLPCKGNS